MRTNTPLQVLNLVQVWNLLKEVRNEFEYKGLLFCGLLFCTRDDFTIFAIDVLVME